MKKFCTGILAALMMLPSAWADAPKGGLSDQQIKKVIIEQSIAQTPGNCPCPYHSASNGSRCGKRSAYNRAGGYAPLCFPEDVTPAMILDYKKRR